MRLPTLGLVLAGAAAAIGACAHEEKGPIAVPQFSSSDAGALPEPPPAPQQYLLADPPTKGAAPAAFLVLGKGEGIGAIVDGLRVVSSAGATRAAKEVTDPPLAAVDRVPSWLGGGFLFRSPTALYRAEAFDGALQPIATLPSAVHSISFGPKTMLVRGGNGERWAFELPSGKRTLLEPQGLADIAALRDGRGVAFTDTGAALVTADGGVKWQDVTAQLRGKPEKVFVHEEALWLVDATGRAMRVEQGGRLSSFDKAPTVKPPELRPKDPRWHSDEPPVRKALRLGAPVDDTTAIVASDGDITRVNLVTGEVVAVNPGRLPPEANCEAVRTPDDVVMVCMPKSGTPFVASHVVGDKAPVIDSFPQAGQFFASDDGSLAFGGPCQRAKVSRSVVCVRAAGGAWQELDLDNLGDAGTMDVARWVPRSDGTAIGFVGGATPGLVDARTGDFRPWTLDQLPANVRTAFSQGGGGHAPSYYRKGGYYPNVGQAMVDRAWSWSGAGLRGWIDNGTSVEVQADGSVAVSPFTFDRVAHSGAVALARQKDGRVWQTIDRGAHWTEVAAPFLSRSTTPTYQNDPRTCSAIGCDLGSWYRIGWVASAPAPVQPPAVVTAPPQVKIDPSVQIACKTIGEQKITAISRGEQSPDDLGLGAVRIPVSNDARTIAITRSPLGRVALNPPHMADSSSDGDSASVRLVHYAYDTESTGDSFTVLGPSKDLASFRRSVAYVPPFDSTATVRRGGFGTFDLVAAGRSLSLRTLDVFREDVHTLTSVTPMTSSDPSAPDDLLFAGGSSSYGLVGAARASGKMRLAIRSRTSDEAVAISAVALANDEFAVLEVDPNGAGHAYKVGATGTSPVDLFDLPAPPTRELYPANADALAVGPRGELAVLRTPSGSEAPSPKDPALLVVPGGATTALAPWSTVESADSAACKSDPSGWRATVHAIGPWFRLSAGDAQLSEDSMMIARVRWSTTRVCLEAVELRLADREQRITVASPSGRPRNEYENLSYEVNLEPWVVAKFTGAPSAGKIAVFAGGELRQPMQCSLTR